MCEVENVHKNIRTHSCISKIPMQQLIQMLGITQLKTNT